MAADALHAKPVQVSRFAVRLSDGALIAELANFVPTWSGRDQQVRDPREDDIQLLVCCGTACGACQVSALINTCAGKKAGSPTVLLPAKPAGALWEISAVSMEPDKLELSARPVGQSQFDSARFAQCPHDQRAESAGP
jgi:hypothetical protein